jgi:hypothetical protein
MPAPTTFEAAEPTCVNCNEEESEHCDTCYVCISGNEQVLFRSMWICGTCLADEMTD